MWINSLLADYFAEYNNGTGQSGFGLAHGPGIDLRPELPTSTPDLLGVDLTHRIDVSDVAAAKGGGGGGKGGGGGGSGGGGGGTSFAPYTSGDAGGYNITIEFKGSWTQEYYDIFKAAADRITDIISKDVADVSVRLKGAAKPVDDILITAELGNIDGKGGVLGQAGPTSVRTSNYLPATASMKFDIADAADFQSQGLFDDIVLHEMLHSIGIGSIWGYKGLVTNGLYSGANAVAEYHEMGGVGLIPVETDGGSGTAGAHWDDATFNNELMTGYINNANVLSAMSVAALADLGYGLASPDFNLLAGAYAYTFNGNGWTFA